MASYYKELTDVSEIVRFRQAGLCYFKDSFNRASVWISLPSAVLSLRPAMEVYKEVKSGAEIVRNMNDGFQYAILVDEDE